MFYTKVTDPDGNTVLEGKQDSQEVISEQAAYVIKSLLKSVVEDSAGTAKYCKISGIDVAAKTGTTNSNYDKWLCGFSNYYTAATWYGFDQNEEVSGAQMLQEEFGLLLCQKYTKEKTNQHLINHQA